MPGLACVLTAMAAITSLMAAVIVMTPAPAVAQTAPKPPVATAAPAAPQLQGRTLDGKAFSLAELRGKVVLVYYWRTDCAVCRSIMSELRANYDGWQGKPFELVAVNMDARRADLVDYERVIAATVPTRQRFPSLWSGEQGHADTLLARGAGLPLSVILDSQGKLVSRHEGRMPAEAWDRIAELLP